MTQLRLTFKYSIPDILADKVQVSKPYQNYNARGTPTSFGIDLHFPEMELSKTLKSSDFHFLQGKIEDTMRSWEKKYRTHLDRQHRERRSFSVDEMNREAKEAIEALHGILSNALNVNHVVDWNAAKRRDPFRIDPEQLFESGRRPKFISFDKRGRPVGVDKQDPPIQPTIKKVKEEYGLLARVFRKRNIEADLNTRLEHWREQVEQTEKDNAARETQFRKAEATFRKMEKSFEEQKKRDNDVIAETKLRYEGGDSQW